MTDSGVEIYGTNTRATPKSSNFHFDNTSVTYDNLVRKVNLAPSQMFSFKVSAKNQDWTGIPCRDSMMLYMPEGSSVCSYVELKAIDALTAAGMYSPSSDKVVKLEIKDFELDAFHGSWITTGQVTLPNGKTYKVFFEHLFESSYRVTKACEVSEKNIAPAVKQFLNLVLNHFEFKAYVRSARNASDKLPLMAKNKSSIKSGPLHAPIDSYSVPKGMPRNSLNYHALIIGNNRYQEFPQLQTAVNDARSIAEILKSKYGFSTKVLLDASRDDILNALYQYRSHLSQNDALLIYYAGHGWLDEDAGEGYWLPVDANRGSIINWLPNAAITAAIRAIQARHILIVADSCYSGTLTRGVSVGIRAPNYFDKIMMKKARSVIASGGLEPVTDGGGADNHSAFAAAFLKALNENTGALDGTGLFSKIRRPVMLSTEQTPEYSDIRKAGHEGGDFLFIRTAR